MPLTEALGAPETVEHTDVLLTMAEVAAGFAGFTAILLAVLSRDTPLQSLKVGLVHFLQLSLGVVLFALLPSTLASFPLLKDAVWRLSNGVLGIYHFYALWWILSKQRESLGHSEMGPTLTKILSAIGFSIALLHLIVAAGFLVEVQVFAFLFGLLWILAMALVNFVAILLHRLNME